MHFANPIPESAAIARDEIEDVISQAIIEADEQGVTGKDNTPFILERIRQLTGGDSIIANRALITSNVRRGTLVATELSRLEQTGTVQSARSV
jgi:pseudouridylate synthase / pseudouridine kinase